MICFKVWSVVMTTVSAFTYIPRQTLKLDSPRLHATNGGVFDDRFLSSISKFYSPDTATELMGPLVYSLFRSTRPQTTVELGAGYTTFWLAKAAADAAEEARTEAAAAAAGEASWVLWNSDVGRSVVEEASYQGAYTGTGQCLARAEEAYFPTVHTVDVFSSEAGSHFGNAEEFQTTIDEILGSAERGSSPNFDVRLQIGEWAEFHREWPDEEPIDFLWLDGFNRETFDLFWPLVNEDGGVAVLHSTLNNHKNWNFVQELKLEQATSKFCDYELVSLLEPHKWQQNSCTLLRKTKKYNPSEHLVRGRA